MWLGKVVVCLGLLLASQVDLMTLVEGDGRRLLFILLLGWDIERRPGFAPTYRDATDRWMYVPPVFSFAGGDFREAGIYNGKVFRKGWYIHPKTKQRIETGF